MKLNEIADKPGARKKRIRIGRGIGSGTGKTGGRGGKGQTARSGVRIKGFEGGQMPLHRRLPKRGFNNTAFQLKLNEVNLGKVQEAIDAKLLDAGADGRRARRWSRPGVLRRAKDGVRLLGNGELKAKVEFRGVRRLASRRSPAVEKAGGSVKNPGTASVKRAKRPPDPYMLPGLGDRRGLRGRGKGALDGLCSGTTGGQSQFLGASPRPRS